MQAGCTDRPSSLWEFVSIICFFLRFTFELHLHFYATKDVFLFWRVFDEHHYFFCNTHSVSQDLWLFCNFFYREWNRVTMTVGVMSFWLQFLNLHGNSWLFAKHVACSIVALASTLVKLKLKSDHYILNNGDDGAAFYIRDLVKSHEMFKYV